MAKDEMYRLKLGYAKRYLHHINEVRRARDAAREELAVIEAVGQPGGIRYDKPNVQTSPSDDAIPRAVDLIMSRAPGLRELISGYTKEYEEFELSLVGLKSVGAAYMIMYYTMDIPWHVDPKKKKTDEPASIEEFTGLSRSTITKRCEEALVEMYDKELIPWQYRMPNQQAV